MNQSGALKVNNFRKKYKSYASIVKRKHNRGDKSSNE